MFGYYFNHSQIERYIALFGSLFNDFHITRTTEDGKIVKQQVPLSYSPKEYWIAKLKSTKAGTRISLPEMAFEVGSPRANASVNFNATHRFQWSHPDDPDQVRHTYTPIPLVLPFTLTIAARKQSHAFQIFEQIIPYFKPSLNISANIITELPFSDDVEITSTNISFEQEWEMDSSPAQTLFQIQMDFDMDINLYGRITSQGRIKEAIAHIYDEMDSDIVFDQHDEDLSNAAARVTTAVDPLTADPDDVYTIETTILEQN